MDLNEQYFDSIFENLSREHVKLIGTLRTSDDAKATQRQIALIASAVTAIVKLRNFRKALAERRD
jgi:hypothetical protein